MRFIAVFFISFLLLSGCSGNQGGSDGYATPDQAKAVNIHPTLWYWAAVNGAYLGTMDPGEVVGITDRTERDSKNAELVQVKMADGKEVWTYSMFLVSGTRPGIIVKEGFLYKEPNAKSLTEEKVPQYTIVAGLKDPKSPDFVQVSFLSPKNNAARYRMYVKSENVSFFDADIQATLLFQKAQAAKDPEVKKEFLASAVKLDSPSFKQMFATELAVLENMNVTPAESGETEPYQGTFLCTEDGIAIRESPDENSAEVGIADKNEKIIVDRRTKGMDEVEESKNYWYHVTDKGWIFGEYVIETID